MNKTTLRPAIAMLELIFALVIMGIVLMSAPMLVSKAQKSGFVAIQQEAINEAASHLNMLLGYHWDENSADERYLDIILRVSNDGDTDLNEYNNTGRRIGTPEVSYRTFIRFDGKEFNATVPAGLGNDSGEKNDIDDFIGNSSLTLVETSSSDYVEKKTEIDINTSVTYIGDSPGGGTYQDPGPDNKLTFTNPFSSTAPGGSTNIKHIQVTLTSSGISELDKKIVLHAFSCNIGGYKLEERDF